MYLLTYSLVSRRWLPLEWGAGGQRVGAGLLAPWPHARWDVRSRRCH